MNRGLSFGHKHGHRTTLIPKKKQRSKLSNRRGILGYRTKFIR
jgi:hypothetical protein